MPRFLVIHRHAPDECGAAFAAWQGFDSPLRRSPAVTSCLVGRHEVWWTVEAPDLETVRAQLPPYVADRADVAEVRDFVTP